MLHQRSFISTLRNATLLLLFLTAAALTAQTPDPKTAMLLGRWEVLNYSEQGVQVDKKQTPLPQAVAVYVHIREQRARIWYGYNDYDDMSRRELKAYERWSTLDSLVEVERVTEAIRLPYFATFFADSTLSMYNKDAKTGSISFPEVRHFSFIPATMSLDIMPGVGNQYSMKSDVQILLLTPERMTLYIPEEAEIVELIKTAYTVP